MGEHDDDDLSSSAVCCLCGDVGFSNKLFLCHTCGTRYQHSYCSNYYDERVTSGMCDWCQSDQKRGGVCGRKMPTKKDEGSPKPCDSSFKYKKQDPKGVHVDQNQRDKGKSSSSSSKPVNRRYKLLKDVMC